jgi:hypothetical protein
LSKLHFAPPKKRAVFPLQRSISMGFLGRCGLVEDKPSARAVHRSVTDASFSDTGEDANFFSSIVQAGNKASR